MAWITRRACARQTNTQRRLLCICSSLCHPRGGWGAHTFLHAAWHCESQRGRVRRPKNMEVQKAREIVRFYLYETEMCCLVWWILCDDPSLLSWSLLLMLFSAFTFALWHPFHHSEPETALSPTFKPSEYQTAIWRTYEATEGTCKIV